ncbi:MAG: hydroxyacid dehydrogenase [Candidatus Accumulibacter sp.]|jgi:D-3-phosphoglycerate dehydrogenase|nr:hydroxyacid dehydrogenase [Accumulibacter sp.]
MYTVVITAPVHPDALLLLGRRSDLVTVRQLTDLGPEGISRGVTGADAILVRTQLLPREVLELAPDLRIVSRSGVGTDNVDVAHLTVRKIPMAISIDANVISVAEHALMLMLGLSKQLLAADEATRNGNFGPWRERRIPTDLAGKTVLIAGFGRIGRRLGELCVAIGMKVIAYDPFLSSSPVSGVSLVGDLKKTLPECDFVSLHLPLDPETRNLIGAAEFAGMKNTAFLINAARGGIVDEDALDEALNKGEIAGAGLDVFAHEPPDGKHPLMQNKKVYLTPHSAAFSEEAFARMGIQAAQNILDCLEGKLQARVVVNGKDIGM